MIEYNEHLTGEQINKLQARHDDLANRIEGLNKMAAAQAKKLEHVTQEILRLSLQYEAVCKKLYKTCKDGWLDERIDTWN